MNLISQFEKWNEYYNSYDLEAEKQLERAKALFR
jgi:hypothetical protein